MLNPWRKYCRAPALGLSEWKHSPLVLAVACSRKSYFLSLRTSASMTRFLDWHTNTQLISSWNLDFGMVELKTIRILPVKSKF